MDIPTSDEEVQGTSDAPSDGQEKNTRTARRTPSIIVGTIAVVVVALSLFYLLRPEPLLVQGEAPTRRGSTSPRASTDASRKYPSNAARTSPRTLC
jgi:HlyD family secretion protein